MCLAIEVNLFVLLKLAPSKYLRIIIVSRTSKPDLLRTNILFHFIFICIIILLLYCCHVHLSSERLHLHRLYHKLLFL